MGCRPVCEDRIEAVRLFRSLALIDVLSFDPEAGLLLLLLFCAVPFSKWCCDADVGTGIWYSGFIASQCTLLINLSP